MSSSDAPTRVPDTARTADTPPLEVNGYRLVAWVFLRLLALIYLAAFVSLAVQTLATLGQVPSS
jgi:hypothetical protein